MVESIEIKGLSNTGVTLTWCINCQANALTWTTDLSLRNCQADALTWTTDLSLRNCQADMPMVRQFINGDRKVILM